MDCGVRLRYLALYTTDRSLQSSDPSHVFLSYGKIKRESNMTQRKGVVLLIGASEICVKRPSTSSSSSKPGACFLNLNAEKRSSKSGRLRS